ncbi:MAG TPA: GPW/gp25 family protein [Candidatus Binataceae bacterium]
MAAGAITLADITSADWSLKLGAIGQVVQGIADVDQCIVIILTTPLGSDPLRPTFGSDIWRYIDFPINIARPSIVRELTSAITTWEPRVTVLNVATGPVLDGSTQSGAQLTVTVTWQLKLSGAPTPAQSTSVTIPGASLS